MVPVAADFPPNLSLSGDFPRRASHAALLRKQARNIIQTGPGECPALNAAEPHLGIAYRLGPRKRVGYQHLCSGPARRTACLPHVLERVRYFVYQIQRSHATEAAGAKRQRGCIGNQEFNLFGFQIGRQDKGPVGIDPAFFP